MANPFIPQGTLNRLRGSILWATFPALNITAPFLGRDGISLALEGNSTDFIDTMTGAVTSPTPYMKATITINLLRSQALANLYKQQMETNTLMGDLTLRFDAATMQPYGITNTALQTVREMRINGEDSGWIIIAGGYYNINQALYNF